MFFSHRNFYTFFFGTHIFFYTQPTLTKKNTQQTFPHRKKLRREAFTQRDFTHRNFNILHRDALIHMCVCSVMYIMWSRCFLYVLLCMRCCACIILHVLWSMSYYVCIVMYVLLCIYCEVCIVEYVSLSMYCSVCIVK